MADERFNQFLDQNRQPGQPQNGPVNIRDSIAQMRETKANRGTLPYIENLLGRVANGMTQVIETPYNIVNRAPQLINLLPGEQGIGTNDELAAALPTGQMRDIATTMFPSKDPLIDAVANHYPGMENINKPNPEYPMTNRIATDVGVGIGTMGAGTLMTGAKGLAGLFGKYLGEPLLTSPVRTVAGQVAGAAGAEGGRQVADHYDVQNPVGRFALEMAGSMSPVGLVDSVEAGGRRLLAREGGADTLAAMDNLGIRPSIGLVGNQNASTLENAAAILPFFGSVSKNVQTGQIDDFGNILRDTAETVRPKGSFPRADATMIGEQVYDIAKSGLGRMKSAFGQREDELMNTIGAQTPIDVTNTRQAIADMIPRVDPEMQSALQHELDLLDQMVITNKTVTQQPVTKTSSVLGANGQPITTQTSQAVESVTPTNTVPYEQFRSWRTNVGRRTDQPSIKGGQSKQLYSAITKDLEGAADNAGVGQDFRTLMSDQARAHNDELRMSEGGDIPAMENIATHQTESGQSFFQKSLSNPDRVELLKRNATPEQWQQFAGDTMEYLGLAKDSAQGAAGDLISPNTFLTNWNKLDPRVKNIMFDDALGTRQTLDDLAIVAEAMRQRGNSSNFSNTAGVGMSAAALSPAGIPAMAGNIPGALAGAGMTYATVKALMSQTMARWAANQGISLGDKMITQGATAASRATDGNRKEPRQRRFTPRPQSTGERNVGQ